MNEADEFIEQYKKMDSDRFGYYTVETREKFVVFKVFGLFSRRESMVYNQNTRAAGKRSGLRNFLIDLTECTSVQAVLRGYWFSHGDLLIKDWNKETANRIAFLVTEEDYSDWFAEWLDEPRLFTRKLFTNLQLAERFLSEDESLGGELQNE